MADGSPHLAQLAAAEGFKGVGFVDRVDGGLDIVDEVCSINCGKLAKSKMC